MITSVYSNPLDSDLVAKAYDVNQMCTLAKSINLLAERMLANLCNAENVMIMSFALIKARQNKIEEHISGPEKEQIFISNDEVKLDMKDAISLLLHTFQSLKNEANSVKEDINMKLDILREQRSHKLN